MNKITVMIVDDEKLVIEDLTSIVDWDANGFEIVATVRNGKQALAKFKELFPQVVITDIKMPFMDGLELAHEIRKLNSQTKIILLTAYSDFGYAKQAIEHGIMDYLLKSEISEQTITSKLESLRAMIIAEDRTSGFVTQKLIQDLFNNKKYCLDSAMYDKSIERLLTTPGFYYIIEEDVPLPVVANYLEQNSSHYEYEIISYCMSACFTEFSIRYACAIRHNQVLLSVQPQRNYSQSAIQSGLLNGAATLKQELKDRFKVSFTAYVISSRLCLPELSKLYSDFNKRFYAKYLLGSGSVYDLQDRKLDLTEKEASINEINILELINKLDSNGLLAYIDELYVQVMPPNLNYYGMLSISQTLYAVLKKFIDELLPTEESIDISPKNNSNLWLDAQSVKNWMKGKFEILIRTRRKLLENKYSREIIKAILYIYKYFDNKDLKIDQIAANVGLSSARMSVIFKKETGCTINEFITGLRIKKAKELLDTGEYKVYEIAAKVGYGSSQYFSQIFYLETGLSPNDYRRRSSR